tara:strand:+ start:1403 stop:1942 length:540 start_codon:yes stop_codon:yes gene_type:complete
LKEDFMTEKKINLEKVLISKIQIEKRIEDLGLKISKDYEGKELHLVGVLNGAFIFLADLARQLKIPCKICFLQASSYNDKKISSGKVKLMHNLDLKDKDVLVVEDIFDTGLTLKCILEDLQLQEPKSLEVCALLSKLIPDKIQINVKYIGFEIDDRFVVGYGLDYAENFREIPYIACIN